jgi:hypothetical protein
MTIGQSALLKFSSVHAVSGVSGFLIRIPAFSQASHMDVVASEPEGAAAAAEPDGNAAAAEPDGAAAATEPDGAPGLFPGQAGKHMDEMASPGGAGGGEGGGSPKGQRGSKKKVVWDEQAEPHGVDSSDEEDAAESRNTRHLGQDQDVAQQIAAEEARIVGVSVQESVRAQQRAEIEVASQGRTNGSRSCSGSGGSGSGGSGSGGSGGGSGGSGSGGSSSGAAVGEQQRTELAQAFNAVQTQENLVRSRRAHGLSRVEVFPEKEVTATELHTQHKRKRNMQRQRPGEEPKKDDETTSSSGQETTQQRQQRWTAHAAGAENAQEEVQAFWTRSWQKHDKRKEAQRADLERRYQRTKRVTRRKARRRRGPPLTESEEREARQHDSAPSHSDSSSSPPTPPTGRYTAGRYYRPRGPSPSPEPRPLVDIAAAAAEAAAAAATVDAAAAATAAAKRKRQGKNRDRLRARRGGDRFGDRGAGWGAWQVQVDASVEEALRVAELEADAITTDDEDGLKAMIERSLRSSVLEKAERDERDRIKEEERAAKRRAGECAFCLGLLTRPTMLVTIPGYRACQHRFNLQCVEDFFQACARSSKRDQLLSMNYFGTMPSCPLCKERVIGWFEVHGIEDDWFFN